MKDPINPDYYQRGGAQLIDFLETLPYNRGAAGKYVIRAGAKDPSKEIEDLEKARWYIDREIARLKGGPSTDPTARERAAKAWGLDTGKLIVGPQTDINIATGRPWGMVP